MLISALEVEELSLPELAEAPFRGVGVFPFTTLVMRGPPTLEELEPPPGSDGPDESSLQKENEWLIK